MSVIVSNKGVAKGGLRVQTPEILEKTVFGLTKEKKRNICTSTSYHMIAAVNGEEIAFPRKVARQTFREYTCRGCN